MQTPGDAGRAHVDACATCGGCEQCRWVATQAKATNVIEVKVKVRHFCEHHGIDTPDQFIMAMGEGTWFTVPELRLPAASSDGGHEGGRPAEPFTWNTAKMRARVDLIDKDAVHRDPLD